MTRRRREGRTRRGEGCQTGWKLKGDIPRVTMTLPQLHRKPQESSLKFPKRITLVVLIVKANITRKKIFSYIT